ncbi:hypothetical protein ACFELO_01775 [Oceanicaulis sp. LC35]|uniref:hypothetical protein n=1 Tax=Oceanicaulis sp. LC35 TaxID=3349635 RepID=UPI003F87B85B
MTAFALSQRWALPMEALTSRLGPAGLKWSSGGAALVLHLGLGVAALTLMQMQSRPAPVIPRTLNVTLFTPVVAEAPDEPVVETVTETPPIAELVPQDRVEPAPVEPDSQAEPPAPAQASTLTPPASTVPAGPTQVLTAEGGEAGWAPDTGVQVSERTAGALRGLLCAGGSEHTRAAAGCDPASQTDPNGYAVYASAEEIAKIESAFGPIETLRYDGGSTVNLSGFSLPGQVNNNQPHYVSGVHSVFGQLPVSDKVRDPGFGD